MRYPPKRRRTGSQRRAVLLVCAALLGGSLAMPGPAQALKDPFVVPSLVDPACLLTGSLAEFDLLELVAGGDLSCRDSFHHPLTALSQVPGPLPLYEVLNDAAGNRYVVGSELNVPAEGEPGTTRTGLFTAERRAFRDDELRKDEQPPVVGAAPKVNPDLEAAIAGLPPEQPVRLVASLRDANLLSVQTRLDREIAEGVVGTSAEWAAAHDRIVQEQADANARVVAAAAESFVAAGGTIRFACANLPCLVADVPAGSVQALARRSDVVQLDVERMPTPDGMTGTEIRNGAQLRQFLDSPYDFDGNGVDESWEGDNVNVAIIESGGFIDHDGYREAGGYSFRYGTGTNSTGKWLCDDDGCESVDSFPDPSNHASGAAGLLMGDLGDGQLASVQGAAQEQGSGYSPESRAHFYDFETSLGAVATLDHIAGLTASQRIPELVSNSWSLSEGVKCVGNGQFSQAANRLYRDGVAIFKSAGNSGGSATDCRVGAPGAAVGVFTVGAHMSLPADQQPAADARTVRTAGIYESGDLRSAWGGNANEGQNRSLVSITAPGTRTNLFNSSGSLSNGGIICCTSHATPTAAASAASFIDFYRAGPGGHFIDDPGVLYSNMLLMGDRQGSSQSRLSSKFDHRWGSGRLRMRKFDADGLDAPSTYANAWTCVSDQEVYSFPVNGGAALNGDVDAFKATAYWFDYRHDGTDGSGNAGRVADVDMEVVNSGGLTLRGDYDAADNKARVFVDDVGGQTIKLQLRGFDVEGHTDPVCGQNSIRVFFALFAEDSDRESPTYDQGTGMGVYPESL